ncbi:thioredoxin [Pseudoflavonifractor sp. HCP28S3_F10]|uniref:thioredoxin n=1 Tax=Pseudoflavonifractor sp. HCP28S3_F10 TaxID=3438947 RepID=UPI003F8ADAC8
MKEIVMFVQQGCPHCKRAFKWQEVLTEKFHPEWRDVPVRVVDELEEKEYADSFDYYYVPSYYVDGVKVHEGPVTQQDVERVFALALAE